MHIRRKTVYDNYKCIHKELLQLNNPLKSKMNTVKNNTVMPRNQRKQSVHTTPAHREVKFSYAYELYNVIGKFVIAVPLNDILMRLLQLSGINTSINIINKSNRSRC